jgi:signal peptide peptidase SppA
VSYARVLAHFYGQPWAIMPEKLAEIEAFLRRKAAEPKLGKKERKAGEPAAVGARGGNYQMVGRTAVVPLLGVMMLRCGPLERMSGATSTEEAGATIDALAGDKSVKSIVLAIDSPGGTVAGTPELADRVARAAGQKKVVAVADALMASAAYFVGSQAAEVYATPSALVGSIGVIASHIDESKADEIAGVKATYITAGKYKAEGYEPLTEEGRAYTQNLVDQMYGQFVKAVAKGRGVSESTVRGESWGQGRVLTAADAKGAGMVNGIATLETVLRRLGATGDSGGARAEMPARLAVVAAARARAVELAG